MSDCKRLLCITAMLLLVHVPTWAEGISMSQRIEDNMHVLFAMTENDTAKYTGLARNTMQMGIDTGQDTIVAECYNCLVTYFLVSPHCDVPKATRVLDRFRVFKERTSKFNDWYYILWQNCILMYYEENDVLRATAELNRMLAYAKEHDDAYGLACVYTMFGFLYEEYSYDTAMENYELALKYVKLSGKDQKYSYIYQSMAHTAFYVGKYDETFKYIDLALQMNPAPKQEQSSDCLRMRAYMRIGDKAEATKCYNRLKQQWDDGDIASSYERTVAAAFCEYLCKYSNPDESQQYWEYIDEPLETQIAYYKAKRNYQKALELTEQLDSIHRRTVGECEKAQIANANIYYNTQQLKDDYQRLELESVKNRMIMLGVIVAALLVFAIGSIYIIIIIRRHNRRLRIERDRKELARKKAVRLSEMKTMFIKNLSHEVRTPLNSIIGFNELLNNSDIHFSPEERTEMLEAINQQANALILLHDNVIYLSRIDSLDIKPKLMNVALKDVCADALDKVRSKVLPTVEIVAGSATSTNAALTTDKRLLSTALECVLDNAAKFTQKGQITIDIEDGSDNIQIVVTDTGEGIKSEAAEQIFERFEKLGSHDSGFGLGLSIARESLRLIGSSIRLDTTYTDGARFVIVAKKH